MIGSTTSALSPNVSVLIAGRVVQAIGGAMLGPAAVALLLDAVPATRRTFAMSIWSAVGSVATASGPSLGAWLVDVGGCRWAFWTGVPFGILAWVVGFRTFEERRVTERRFPDPWSSGLLLVGIGSLTLALVQSRTWGWTSPSTLIALATSATTLIALALRSSRIESPLIDPALLRFPGVRYAVSGAVLYGAGFFALFFGAIQFLSFVWEYDTMETGLLFVATPASMVVMSPIAGRLAERLGLDSCGSPSSRRGRMPRISRRRGTARAPDHRHSSLGSVRLRVARCSASSRRRAVVFAQRWVATGVQASPARSALPQR